MRDSRGDIRVSIPVGGRLNDPRFDFRDAIRSAIRTVAVKAITRAVSWIGRLHVSPDSSVEQVQVDPIRFQVGEATFTPDGQTQAMRVAAFLEQVGEVRMALTPVVSGRDLATLRRRSAEAAVERLAGDARISREAAATRLLIERRPDRPVPVEPAATLNALARPRPRPPTRPISPRGAWRPCSLRSRAQIQPARLFDAPLVERPDSTEGAVELSLLEPDTPRRSEFLRLLPGLGGPERDASQ